jgi:hypothetical protein
VVIWGWTRIPTFLASKLDECGTCGVIGHHHLVRKASWFTLFWAPVLLLWVSHGLWCNNCGAWTKLSYRQVRGAMKSGTMPLDRARPKFAERRPGMADSWGRMPSVAAYFDPVHVNPKRGASDVYLKVWLVAVVVLVGLVLFAILT